ncbi:MAG TPA: hypothetical protein DEF06_01960 [Clostridiales bacterium]|nr:hypothetical protein [Clostridiales bacterium]
MKKGFVKMAVICILCTALFSAAALTGFAAEDVSVNIASMEGATHHWSGTWGNNVEDSASGDPGSNCFNGITSDKWGSAELTDATPQWISVVFPSAQEISGFKIWQADTIYTDNRGFTVEYQNGTDTWQTALTVTAEDLGTSDTQKWTTFEKEFETPVTATAFRIYFTAAQKGKDNVYAVELSELEVYKKEAARVGSGAGDTGKPFDKSTVTFMDLQNCGASASSSSQPPINAIDGSLDTKWGSEGNNVPQWFQIEFDEPVNIAGIRLHQDHHWSDVTDMTVQISVDGGALETVYTLTDGSLGEDYEYLFDTVWNTDTIRFVFTKAGDRCIREAGGAPTTSIDMKEVLLYTAVVDAEDPPTSSDPGNTDDPTEPNVPNQPTGDSMSFLFLICILTAGGSALNLALRQKRSLENK